MANTTSPSSRDHEFFSNKRCDANLRTTVAGLVSANCTGFAMSHDLLNAIEVRIQVMALRNGSLLLLPPYDITVERRPTQCSTRLESFSSKVGNGPGYHPCYESLPQRLCISVSPYPEAAHGMIGRGKESSRPAASAASAGLRPYVLFLLKPFLHDCPPRWPALYPGSCMDRGAAQHRKCLTVCPAQQQRFRRFSDPSPSATSVISVGARMQWNR